MEPRRFPSKIAQLFPRQHLTALTDDIEFLSLWRWTQLSLLVGAVVGLAAAAVHHLLGWSDARLLHPAVGNLYQGEGLWWALLLVPTFGGLMAGLVTWKFAPEASGAGTGNVIDAFHNHEGQVRRRVPLVKLVATLFSLGSGGSAGREGPMAHIGAGLGSALGRALKLSPRERRLLLLAGAAGAISALLHTPLGAAIWALEVLYHEDVEAEGMFPCLISSVTAYSVMTLFSEPGSLFHVSISYDFLPAQLFFYGILGLACALFGVVWIKGMHRSTEFWNELKIPTFLKPAIGGLLLGALVIWAPWVFAAGVVWLQDALLPIDDVARKLPIGYTGFFLLLGIALAKMLATSFTVATGGSGGKFAPGLFIGGMIGGAFGLLFHELAPSIVTQPGAFVFVGMAAFYAGVTKVPLATIILVSELFGSYDLLVPIMFTEMIVIILLRNLAMYPEQVKSRFESPAHTTDFTVDILQHMRVRDHFTKGRASTPISESMTLHDFLDHVSSTADSFFVVHNASGTLTGIASLSNVRSVVGDQDVLEHMLVSDAMWPLKSIGPDMELGKAMTLFLSSHYDHLPVIETSAPNVVLGMLSQQQIFAAYNAELVRRRLAADKIDAKPTSEDRAS